MPDNPSPVKATFGALNAAIVADTGAAGLWHASPDTAQSVRAAGSVFRAGDRDATKFLPRLEIEIPIDEQPNENLGRALEGVARIKIITDRDNGWPAKQDAIEARLVQLLNLNMTLTDPDGVWQIAPPAFLRPFQVPPRQKENELVCEFAVAANL